MLPSSDYFNLVDADVSFRVQLRGGDEIRIVRAKAGLVRLSVNGQSALGDASAILWRLNALIARFDPNGGPLAISDDMPPSLDAGSGKHFIVTPEPARSKLLGLPPTTSYRVEILSSDVFGTGPVVVEVLPAGAKNALYEMRLVDPDTFVEIGRFSRRAPPPELHADIVSTISWRGSPDAEALFIDMYGEAALEAVQAAHESDRTAWMASMMEEIKRFRILRGDV